MSIVASPGNAVDKPSSGQIADVVGLILDKGLVIDVFVRVSLVGIEILTIDARVVVASVDTYLRFAEAAGRLNIEEATKRPGLPEVLSGVTGGLINGATAAVPKALEPATQLVGAVTGSGQEEPQPAKRATRRSKEDQ